MMGNNRFLIYYKLLSIIMWCLSIVERTRCHRNAIQSNRSHQWQTRHFSIMRTVFYLMALLATNCSIFIQFYRDLFTDRVQDMLLLSKIYQLLNIIFFAIYCNYFHYQQQYNSKCCLMISSTTVAWFYLTTF